MESFSWSGRHRLYIEIISYLPPPSPSTLSIYYGRGQFISFIVLLEVSICLRSAPNGPSSQLLDKSEVKGD